jgi:hypothetical protein
MWEFWVNLILLFILGVLGASSVIVKKRPEAKDLIDKLAKISGYVGIIAVLWGIWDLIWLLRFIRLLGHFPLTWITMLAVTVVFLGLGFIFGYGMAAAYMSEDAKAKAEGIRQKVLKFQIPLGWLSLGLVVWLCLLNWVIY